MKCVIMTLIGAPAVGKTTFARSLSHMHDNELVFKFLHVDYDKLMPVRDWEQASVHKWKMDRSVVLRKIEQLLQELSDFSSASYDGIALNLEHSDRLIIVIDDNMYYKSMRQVYFRLAQTYNCGFCQIYFKIDIKLALTGNSQRSGRDKVPEHVIRNIYAKIEAPSLFNYWEKNSIVILSRDFQRYKTEIVDLIIFCLENPENVAEVEVKMSPGVSVCHELDLALRKLISVKIVEARGKIDRKELKVFSKMLTEVKGSILHDFKNGVFHFDPLMSLEVFAKEVFLHKLKLSE